MIMKLISLLLLTAITTAVAAPFTYPPEMPGAKVETYKTVGETKLALYIFNPEGHRPSDKRPAIVFFFGGGWTSGSPKQFEQQCRYLASRGMVAISADYRVASRHQVKAVDCVADARDAMAWVRAHAAELGVDPARIAAGGGSAGGHIAACTGTIPGGSGNESVPNAMVLFNPALVLAPLDGKESGERITAERLGVEPRALSPAHHVKAGAPPTIVFHGKADSTVPYATAEAFAQAMKRAGNRCELAGFEGQQHGFFNFGRGDDAMFRETLKQADRFLVSLGWLSGEPTIETFFGGKK
jgi:acetyl esterase/lipase